MLSDGDLNAMLSFAAERNYGHGPLQEALAAAFPQATAADIDA